MHRYPACMKRCWISWSFAAVCMTAWITSLSTPWARCRCFSSILILCVQSATVPRKWWIPIIFRKRSWKCSHRTGSMSETVWMSCPLPYMLFWWRITLPDRMSAAAFLTKWVWSCRQSVRKTVRSMNSTRKWKKYWWRTERWPEYAPDAAMK